MGNLIVLSLCCRFSVLMVCVALGRFFSSLVGPIMFLLEKLKLETSNDQLPRCCGSSGVLEKEEKKRRLRHPREMLVLNGKHYTQPKRMASGSFGEVFQ